MKSIDEFFRGIMNNTPIAMSIFDINGRYLYVSKETATILGKSVVEVEGKLFSDFFPDDMICKFMKNIQKVLTTQSHFFQETILDLGFGERYFQTWLYPIFEADQSILYISSISLDVTELRKAEQQLIWQKQQFESLFTYTNDAIVFYDINSKIRMINEQCNRLFGWSEELMIGKHVNDIFSSGGKIDDFLNLVILQGVKVEKETIRYHVDGTAVHVLLKGGPVKEDDRIVGGYAVYKDISAQKQVEASLALAKQEAENANEAKSMFLSAMSHEIRTPMNAIIGMTELLEELVESPEKQKYVTILKKNGKHLLSIVNAVLDLAKIESGSVNLDLKPMNVCDLLMEVIDCYQHVANQKKVELILSINPSEPKIFHVQTDGDKLRQVLVNLLGNALKFTHEGHVELCVEITSDNQDLRFSVKDTGIGIPKDKQTQIFESFKQSDSSTTRMYGGTGLGLAISRKLVELMGGTIAVTSEEGKGSHFSFSIPYQQKAVELVNQVQAMQTVGVIHDKHDHESGNSTIMIVDDVPDNRLIIQAYLKNKNYHIEMASNGKEALEKYMENHEIYDLIFMDIQMPVMDGYQATKEIRKFEKTRNLQPVHIVALTAYALAEDRQKALEAGCDEHMSKPVYKKELLKMLEELGGKKK